MEPAGGHTERSPPPTSVKRERPRACRCAGVTLLHVRPTCCAGAAQAGLRRHGRVDRGGGAAAEVHHGGRGRRGGRGLLHRGLWRLRGLLALSRVGRDAVLLQELLQVHVFQLEVVSIVGEGLVPQSGAEEGRLGVVGRAALILELLLLLFLLSKP